MDSPKIQIPEWLQLKVQENDQKIDENQFTALSYYYKQITKEKLKRSCPNCINDAFIIIKIHLKNQ